MAQTYTYSKSYSEVENSLIEAIADVLGKKPESVSIVSETLTIIFSSTLTQKESDSLNVIIGKFGFK